MTREKPKMKTGIVPYDTSNLDARLKVGDAYYHSGKKIGTVTLVLSSSYCLEFEPDANVREATLEETAEMVDKRIL